MIEGPSEMDCRISRDKYSINFITKRQSEAIPQIDNHQSTIVNPLSYGAQVISPGVNLILSSPLGIARTVKPYLPEALQVMAQA